MTGTLILADDLSGAADCASACLRLSPSPFVLIDPLADPGDAAVVALDLDSRAKAVQEAGTAMAAAVGRLLTSRTQILYQKMDSTLRGHWARETACVLQVITSVRGRRPLAVVAPAFPAAGRTTVAGRTLVNGLALEETEIWAHEGRILPAEPGAWLAAEGLRVAHVPIEAVGLGPESLSAMFRHADASGADAIVCDAQSEADLDAIAQTVLAVAPMPLCVGSAGLMRALARAAATAEAAPASAPTVAAGPVLIVVGSASQVSRNQVRALVQARAVAAVAIAPSALRTGPVTSLLRAPAKQIDAALTAGQDVVVAVDGSEGVDLRQGRQLSAALADLVAPRLSSVGGLVATGGETARAVLTHAGVAGLRVHGEVEPGIPLSTAFGAVVMPVVTKAGAFGDTMALVRCLDAVRGLSGYRELR